jgi:hypothetical protein
MAVGVFALAWPGAIQGVTYLDLAPFAQLTWWSGSQLHRFANISSAGKAENIGLEWDEERDNREVRVRFRGEGQTLVPLRHAGSRAVAGIFRQPGASSPSACSTVCIRGKGRA